jgi:hypothetical protein
VLCEGGLWADVRDFIPRKSETVQTNHYSIRMIQTEKNARILRHKRSLSAHPVPAGGGTLRGRSVGRCAGLHPPQVRDRAGQPRPAQPRPTTPPPHARTNATTGKDEEEDSSFLLVGLMVRAEEILVCVGCLMVITTPPPPVGNPLERWSDELMWVVIHAGDLVICSTRHQ